MVLYGHAVHRCQPLVDADKAELGIEHGKADWGGIVDGFQLGKLEAALALLLVQGAFRPALCGDIMSEDEDGVVIAGPGHRMADEDVVKVGEFAAVGLTLQRLLEMGNGGGGQGRGQKVGDGFSGQGCRGEIKMGEKRAGGEMTTQAAIDDGDGAILQTLDEGM
jgi:hypothetical protein